jgi:hypothetical protein
MAALAVVEARLDVLEDGAPLSVANLKSAAVANRTPHPLG